MSTTLAANWASGIHDPATAEIFTAGMVEEMGPDSAWQFFNVLPSTSLTTQNVGVDGPSAYQQRTDNEEIPLSDVAQRNTKTYTQVEHSNGFSISFKARMFSEAALIARFFAQLGGAAGQLFNESMYDVLEGGFTDTGPDGVSLFDASHPIDKTGGTVSNLGTTALDFDALAAARAVMRRSKTSSGMKLRSEPQFLIVPPETADTARQLVSSAVTSAALQTNTFAGQLQVISSAYIVDVNDWFLASAQNKHQLKMYLAKGPTPEMRIDPKTKALVMDDIVVFDSGYDDFRGTFGANVA
jgi:hypothetical protein